MICTGLERAEIAFVHYQAAVRAGVATTDADELFACFVEARDAVLTAVGDIDDYAAARAKYPDLLDRDHA